MGLGAVGNVVIVDQWLLVIYFDEQRLGVPRMLYLLLEDHPLLSCCRKDLSKNLFRRPCVEVSGASSESPQPATQHGTTWSKHSRGAS